jgi:hypothetical protein
MKSHRDLYPRVCSWENLYWAWRKARRGKRGRAPAATFEFDLEGNLCRLQHELERKTYGPGGYSSFYIDEPKRRLISAAPFRDRVVHHALCNVIEPLFERRFIHDSYANRVGKGTHRALDRCQAFSRRYRYVLQCDNIGFRCVSHVWAVLPAMPRVARRQACHRADAGRGTRGGQRPRRDGAARPRPAGSQALPAGRIENGPAAGGSRRTRLAAGL